MHAHDKRDGRWAKRPDPAKPKDPETPKHKSGKDTKRWCLGVPGREHVGRYEPVDRWGATAGTKGYYPGSLPFRCVNCRKHLKTKVSAWRANFGWLHPDGVFRDYNMTGARPINFYGLSLPPSGWDRSFP